MRKKGAVEKMRGPAKGNRRLKTAAALLIAQVTWLSTPIGSYATVGSVDPSFGAGGLVTGPKGRAEASAIQKDGKIIVAGGNSGDFVLARYGADGSPDLRFGRNGLVTTDFRKGHDSALAVQLQPDGKIVSAGFTCVDESLSHCSFAVSRHLSDGSADRQFGKKGDKGKSVIDIDGAYSNGEPIDAEATSLAIQGDGKIVLGGFVCDPPPAGCDFAVARLLEDGSLDDGSLDGGFGIDGTVREDFGGTDGAFDLAIQPHDGKLVVGGSGERDKLLLGQDFALARFNPDGSLDPTFGAGGKVSTHFEGGEAAFSVLVQPDRSILAGGCTGRYRGSFPPICETFAVAKYSALGAPDLGFGSLGATIGTGRKTEPVAVYGLALHNDGAIAAAGATTEPGVGSSAFPFRYHGLFAMMQLTQGGFLDNTFDKDGVVTADDSGENSGAADVEIYDGKMVGVGSASISGAYEFALARYLRD